MVYYVAMAVSLPPHFMLEQIHHNTYKSTINYITHHIIYTLQIIPTPQSVNKSDEKYSQAKIL
jgi:hypothetical protein